MNKKIYLMIGLVIIVSVIYVFIINKSIAPFAPQSPELVKRTITDICIATCEVKLNSSQDISNGPCLSQEGGESDWVCDVAHNPREAVDDLPENQCNAFRNGTAHHFVEVDENCNLIRAV